MNDTIIEFKNDCLSVAPSETNLKNLLLQKLRKFQKKATGAPMKTRTLFAVSLKDISIWHICSNRESELQNVSYTKKLKSKEECNAICVDEKSNPPRLIAVRQNTHFCFYDLNRGVYYKKIWIGEYYAVESLNWVGNNLLVVWNDGGISVLDSVTCESFISCESLGSIVRVLPLVSGEKFLVFGHCNGEIKLLNTATLKCMKIFDAQFGSVQGVCFLNPEQTLFACISAKGMISVYCMDKKEPIYSFQGSQNTTCYDLLYCIESEILICQSGGCVLFYKLLFGLGKMFEIIVTKSTLISTVSIGLTIGKMRLLDEKYKCKIPHNEREKFALGNGILVSCSGGRLFMIKCKDKKNPVYYELEKIHTNEIVDLAIF